MKRHTIAGRPRKIYFRKDQSSSIRSNGPCLSESFLQIYSEATRGLHLQTHLQFRACNLVQVDHLLSGSLRLKGYRPIYQYYLCRLCRGLYCLRSWSSICLLLWDLQEVAAAKKDTLSRLKAWISRLQSQRLPLFFWMGSCQELIGPNRL